MGMDLLHCVHSGRASATHLIHATIIWSAAAPLDSFEITAHIRRERRIAQFGNEADVRERDIVADQEGALRQRLLDARQIGCEAVLRAVIELARDGSVA